MGYDEFKHFTSKPGTDCLAPKYIRLQRLNHIGVNDEGYVYSSNHFMYKSNVKINDDGSLAIEGYNKRESKRYIVADNTEVDCYGDYQNVPYDFTEFLKKIGSDYIKTVEKYDGHFELDYDVYDTIPEGKDASDFTAYKSDAGITLYVSKSRCDYAAKMTLTTDAAIAALSSVSAGQDIDVIWGNVDTVTIGWDS
jgi:hypothetical protein